MGNAKYYVTTAIDYVNSRPHLGHAYEKLAADVIARYQRQHGKEVLLQVGVDEHSTNVVRRANELGLAPKVYCDQMVAIYEEFFTALQIDYSRLIRTSDSDHLAVVQEILVEVAKKGYIYAGKYEGWYCPSCEAFYRERDLVDEKCPVHDFLSPQWISEYNYYFRLSAFQDAIRQHIEANPQWVEPESRRNDILRRLEDGLEDISISRAVSDWGVPIPAEVNDYIDSETLGLTREELTERLAEHKVYVWFDALLNYVTGAGYGNPEFETTWPANLQLIGKDINWFHAVIESAILLALDLPLPEKIYAHGFITKDGRRISSSLGNLIYPSEVIDKFGLDPLRYYLFRRVSFGQDGDFSWKEFTECYNTSLANILGNLVYRSLKMTEKYFGGVIPQPKENEPVDDALHVDREAACREVTELLGKVGTESGIGAD